MVIRKYNGFIFIYIARPQSKFGSRQKLHMECFHSEFLGPAVKSRTYGHIVSLFETTDCLYADKAIRRGYQKAIRRGYKNGLKWTKDKLLRSRSYAQCRSTLGGRRLLDFLLATNQRAQFRLRHNLGYVAGLATLIDTKNIALNQHSYTV